MSENGGTEPKNVRKKKTGKAIKQQHEEKARKNNFRILLFLLFLVAGGVLTWHYWPEKVSSMDASISRTKLILGAILNYKKEKGVFPPAYRTNVLGEPTVSWRVLILPYFEEEIRKQYKLDELFGAFNLNEKWDGENNKKLLSEMPLFYVSPASKNKLGDGKTNFLTIRNLNSTFPGAKPISDADITDVLVNTVVIFEAHDQQSVFWSSPEDFNYEPGFPASEIPKYIYSGGLVCGMCNGTVNFKNEPSPVPELIWPQEKGYSEGRKVVTIRESHTSPWIALFTRNNEARVAVLREEEEARIRAEERKQELARRKKWDSPKNQLEEDSLLEELKDNNFFRKDIQEEELEVSQEVEEIQLPREESEEEDTKSIFGEDSGSEVPRLE
ncbi:MAG: hypothetical protein Q4C96_01285 [Planctomycetia bacterium]|nr:hypothetical protein [Planctomycetia bacterium]